MLEEIFIDGALYVTGKRAAAIAGVSADYISRLAGHPSASLAHI